MAGSPKFRTIVITVVITLIVAAGAAVVVFMSSSVLQDWLSGGEDTRQGPDQRTSAQIDAQIAALEQAAGEANQRAEKQTQPSATAPAQQQPSGQTATQEEDPLARALGEQAAEEIRRREERRVTALNSPMGESIHDLASIRAARETNGEVADEATGSGLTSDGLAPAPVAGPDTYSLERDGQVLLAAGSVIQAALINEIRSDLPGLIRAEVTNDVYGTTDAYEIVIPRGSMLLGTYENNTSVGQRRLSIAWTRVLFPNGMAVDLERAGGVDADGASGIKGQRRSGFFTALFGTALFSLAESAGRSNTSDSDSDIANAARAITGDTVGQLSDQYFGATLSRGPTFRVRAGTILNVQLARDFYFEEGQG